MAFKKKKNIKMSETVSILTITQWGRYECIKILHDIILEQTYKNIIEWVIVEGSQNREESEKNKDLIMDLLENSKLNFPISYIEYNGQKKIGALRNISNSIAKGDILVCMDDDDYYFPTRVEHCVEMLKNCELAGCSKIFVYDWSSDKLLMMNFTSSIKNHSTNNAFAYRRSYLKNHKYDETVDNAEEVSFTNKYQEKMVQLESNKTLFQNCHGSNTYNKREIFTVAFLQNTDCYLKIKNKPTEIIPKKYFDRYKKIFYDDSDYNDHDIVYFTGGFCIEWDPESKSNTGSEQAIVNLSENWVKKGKSVIVFANVKKEGNYNGVEYKSWKKFPFSRKIKNLIIWRMFGIKTIMNYDYKFDRGFIDFHDNFVNFENIGDNEYSPINNLFKKVNKLMFKSNYHLECFLKLKKFDVRTEQLFVCMNGLRMKEFMEPDFKNENIQRQPFRFCYCSCYTRGLEFLLDRIWPMIVHNEPRAELHVYYGIDSINDENYKNKLRSLLSTKGVMDHGRQPLEIIVREKHLSTFNLYLNNSLAEIDCITIRESIAAGCIPILSNFGVYLERDGLKYDYDPADISICKSISFDILKRMGNGKLIEFLRKKFLNSKTIISWSDISEFWMKEFV